ncbi:O-antigen ligase [Bradyrhizobium sp. JR4.1]|uniref:O-antigen ligase family protein n=1 Tax=Bradyrhizobium sp. JR4.1 TaxID=3156372 RepID=UPI0033942622
MNSIHEVQADRTKTLLLSPLLRVHQAAILLLVALSFYTNVRIGTLTAFDILAATYCLILLPYALPRFDHTFFVEHGLPLAASCLFALATLTSATVTLGTDEHLIKSAILAGDVFFMIIFSYIAAHLSALDIRTIQQALVLSSAVTGVVCIAQGKFGLFLELLPKPGQQLEFWSRPSGLVEHPVEAGLIGAYGAILALDLILDKRRVALNVACILIIVYAETVSASLTGFICMAGGTSGLLLLRGNVRLSTIVLCFAIMAGVGFVMSEYLSNTFFVERLARLSQSGLDYDTLNSRSSQMAEAFDRLITSPTNAILGFGYDPNTRIDNLDIHNGLLAAWYNFGIIGAVSQVLFLVYFASAMIKKSPDRKILGLIVLAVFLLFYLSGPAFFRRSVWIPLFLLAEKNRSRSLSLGQR